MTRAKADNNTTYTRHIGKEGMYGEHKLVTWNSSTGSTLASISENGDGTAQVTLYTADNTPHPRTLPNDRRCWDICEAHVKERGFTTMRRETADLRAYND